jgi:hypothetical protein
MANAEQREWSDRERADMVLALEDYRRRLNNDFTRRHLGTGYDAYVARFTVLMDRLAPVCINHPEQPMRDFLDGDALCQSCCDAWARGEAA